MDRGSVIVRQINGQKKRKKRGERLKEMLAKQGIIWRRRVKNERERERDIICGENTDGIVERIANLQKRILGGGGRRKENKRKMKG